MNSSDDFGILTGRWDGEYSDGTSPTKWTGSVAILQEYMETKVPIKYGQCWVFSGVVTTVCRALGLPARSVTNFASAHDTDGSLTIDVHWDEEEKPMPGRFLLCAPAVFLLYFFCHLTVYYLSENRVNILNTFLALVAVIMLICDNFSTYYTKRL